MAEAVDLLASVCESTAAFGDFDDEMKSFKTPRCRNLLILIVLAAGKAGDILADWIIVGELRSDGSFSDRRDAAAAFGVAVGFATLGTSIEIIASLMKCRLYCISHGASRVLKSIKLNTKLAWPRFLLDDLPATALGIYLLATPALSADATVESVTLINGTKIAFGSAVENVTRCSTTTTTTTVFMATDATRHTFVSTSTECAVDERDAGGFGLLAAELWLVVLSCGYSLCAMTYYLCKSPEGLKEGLERQGVRLVDLRKQGHGAAEMLQAGYGLPSLKEGGYTAHKIRQARPGVTVSELKDAGFVLEEIKAAGFKAGDAREAGYAAHELYVAGFKAAELKAAGFALDELRRAGFATKAAKAAGWTCAEARAAGYLEGFKEAGWPCAEAMAAGIVRLKTAGYSCEDAVGAGCSCADIKAHGYPASEARDAGFALQDMKAAGYTASDATAAGFSSKELKAAGYNIIGLELSRLPWIPSASPSRWLSLPKGKESSSAASSIPTHTQLAELAATMPKRRSTGQQHRGPIGNVSHTV